MWFLGVIAMGCHIDGIVVNTADTQIRCEGGSARGAIVNSGKKKKRKEDKKRHLLNLIPVGFGLINVSWSWKSHMGRETLPFMITLKCSIFQPTWPYTSQLAADPRY